MLDVGQPRFWRTRGTHLRTPTILLLVGIFVLAGFPTSSASAMTFEPPAPRISFVGTLLAKSPPPGGGCGYFFWHQLGLYRIESSYGSVFVGSHVVVDHPSCFGDVFDGVNIGDRVSLTVEVRSSYSTLTVYPGIRSASDKPSRFFIAQSVVRVDRHGWRPTA